MTNHSHFSFCSAGAGLFFQGKGVTYRAKILKVCNIWTGFLVSGLPFFLNVVF